MSPEQRVIAETVWGLSVQEVIHALIDLPPMYGSHATRDALFQFTFDGEEFYVIDWIDDQGDGGVIAQLVPLNDGSGDEH